MLISISVICFLCLLFFFFQAEDGIRDRDVTGVQTCALPISGWRSQLDELPRAVEVAVASGDEVAARLGELELRPVTHFVGGGPARATAYEGALKLREATHL